MVILQLRFSIETNGIKNMRRIPEHEMQIETTRSGGPGGQHVNKVSTKVQLRWNIGASTALTYDEKEVVRTQLEHRINLDDELMIDVSEERSQAQNREVAIEKLNALVNAALRPQKIRRPTRHTRASKERRLNQKRITGEKKRTRRGMEFDE